MYSVGFFLELMAILILKLFALRIFIFFLDYLFSILSRHVFVKLKAKKNQIEIH